VESIWMSHLCHSWHGLDKASTPASILGASEQKTAALEAMHENA